MTNFCIFISLIALFLTVSYVHVAISIKSASPTKVINYLKGNGALSGIKMFVGLIVVLVGVLSLVYSNSSNAEEDLHYFKYTSVYIGLDYDLDSGDLGHGLFCHEDKASDKITSNGGVEQHLVGYKSIDLLAKYTHHSCAFNSDQPTYDAIGLQLEWKFQRK